MPLAGVRRFLPSLVLAAILGYQLFVPPSIGLADNGDFAKIIGTFGLGASSTDEYRYVHLTYRFEPQHHWTSEFHSSETLLAALAVGLNHVFSKDGSFDLRWMGQIHALLVLLAGYLLTGLVAGVSGWRLWCFWTIAIFCFSDVMYVII
jgi:hypothetical protein